MSRLALVFRARIENVFICSDYLRSDPEIMLAVLTIEFLSLISGGFIVSLRDSSDFFMRIS